MKWYMKAIYFFYKPRTGVCNRRFETTSRIVLSSLKLKLTTALSSSSRKNSTTLEEIQTAQVESNQARNSLVSGMTSRLPVSAI